MTLSLARTRLVLHPQDALKSVLQRWNVHRETRAALRDLKPSDLRDLGLTTHDVEVLRFESGQDATQLRTERSGNW